MITSIAQLDFEQKATATPLGRGVVFRLPVTRTGVLLMASVGYGGAPPASLPETDLAQLQREAKAHDFIGYRGSDDAYHYFSMPMGQRYRMTRSSLYLQSMPFPLGFCIFVTFENGTLTVPDTLAMANVDPKECRWALDW